MSIHEDNDSVEIPEEPVEQEQQAEAPVEEQREAPEQKVGQDSMVPLSALNEARAQLRQTQSEINDMRQRFEEMQSLKAEIDEWRNRGQQNQAEDEFNSDPLGTLRKQISGLETKLTTQQQEEKQTREQTEQAQQVFSSIASQVNEFKKTHTDYDDALNHVLSSRKSELLAMGVPESQADQRVAKEAQEIGVSALQAGINPGEMVYNLAKLRGFSATKNAKKLQTVEKGQNNSSTLSGTSGDAGESGFSMTEIENMSDDEFDRWWNKEMVPQQH